MEATIPPQLGDNVKMEAVEMLTILKWIIDLEPNE
jgi:hypothetical protein